MVHVCLVQLTVVTLGPQVADREVVGNAQEPGDDGRATFLVAVDRLPGLEEGLCGQVFCLSRITDKVVDMAVDADNVTVVQLGECRLVAVDSAMNQPALFFAIGALSEGFRRYGSRLRPGRECGHTVLLPLYWKDRHPRSALKSYR